MHYLPYSLSGEDITILVRKSSLMMLNIYYYLSVALSILLPTFSAVAASTSPTSTSASHFALNVGLEVDRLARSGRSLFVRRRGGNISNDGSSSYSDAVQVSSSSVSSSSAQAPARRCDHEQTPPTRGGASVALKTMTSRQYEAFRWVSG